jgi:ATP-dependent Clp protease adaptor protein ClpS
VEDGAVGGRLCDDGGVTSPTTESTTRPQEQVDEERPWVTIVWNDPVNLMSYVTYTLQKLFGYSVEKATQLMLQVHHEGRAVVSSGTREEMERDVTRLHAAGLWATLARD